ncbi:hypothetical protein TWF506_007410 [Arthrobotrys conoides]|uniref:Uncharacterized protein n=1 Tax=Arthrobotrys conoides TaxID=74498 RepID=A0AAN8NP35_9PEZI
MVTKRMPVAPAGVPNGPDVRKSDDVSHRISRRFANSQETSQRERRFERRAVCTSLLLLNLQLQSIIEIPGFQYQNNNFQKYSEKAFDRILAWGWAIQGPGLS